MQSDEMVDGEVFFDEDPELFKLLMLHLRLKGLLGREFAPQIPAPKRGAWNRFTEYLNLEGMKVVDLVDTKLADSQKQLLLLQWLPLKKLKLLYRVTWTRTQVPPACTAGLGRFLITHAASYSPLS